jgi:PRTRC genetic system ThiF family protein
MTTLSLQMEKQYQVLLGAADTIHIMLVGVGGTGSWLALSLGRLAYHARLKGITVRLTFVDHDAVELKNCVRTMFCPAEVGQNKAFSMARRLNLALGMSITANPHPFTAELGYQWARGCGRQATHLLIGAVDNHLARRELAQVVVGHGGRVWGLDLGNGRASGQILIGNLTRLEQLKLDNIGLCNGLPSPYVQEPDLLEPDEEARPLSCADLTLLEEQGLMVNSQVAAIAGQYVYEFSLKRTLRQYATYFTLEPPITTSHCLTASVRSRFGEGPT